MAKNCPTKHTGSWESAASTASIFRQPGKSTGNGRSGNDRRPKPGGSLKNVKYPKLFIAAEKDPLAKSVQSVYDRAAEPRELVLYPGEALHGMDLFYSSTYRDQFLQALLDFVNKLP